ncbi:MAG: aromatic ring-hydroxylating dioxygenase subunit alpha [Acidiferrobacterales bacterium]|nr:aromatic ring-hydroxylating dioxygenase subunit alpha [Acidiferrobacterales bacterium]
MNRPVYQSTLDVTESEIQSVLKPIEEATGMPNSTYTDQGAFEFERDHILSKHWVAIGFAEHLSTNTVKPMNFMGIPIFTAKDKQDNIRVFHNVCSHRGMKLVDKERKTNGLVVCPYHSWTYSVSGGLKATPNIGGVGVNTIENFDCDSKGLKPIRSHIWMGVLFINLSGEAPIFEESAAAMISRYQKLMGPDAEQLLKKGGDDSDLSISLKCNWKLAVENYLEAYHLPFIHPALNTYSPLSKHTPEIFSDNAAGQVTSTFDPGHSSDHPLPMLPSWDKDQTTTGEYPVLYPNLLLGFQANHVFAMIIIPESPGTCREELSIFYVGDAATSEEFDTQRSENMSAWIGVFNEDIEPCERMQIGRNSPGFTGGAFSPILDRCSHHFHQWIARQYQN